MARHDFETFWQAYPRKVGKLIAQKVYEKTRASGVTQAQLLEGIDAYVRHKPAYADYAHPSSWLRAGRWMDEWDTPVVIAPREPWWDECQRIHGGQCVKRWDHEMRKRVTA